MDVIVLDSDSQSERGLGSAKTEHWPGSAITERGPDNARTESVYKE